jgi:imidazolonepropionase-like amidohydrolase
VKFIRWAAVAAAVACCGLIGFAADDPAESGQFTLFKFEQAIGEEHYDVRPDGDLFALTSTFSFTDRGTPVRLSTSAKFDRMFTPARFVIKGDTARITGIDEEVTIAGGNATVRDGTETRQTPVPAGAFTLAGYAPPSMQMELMRYWTSHGRPASVPLLPHGSVRIEPRGRDQIAVGGRTIALDRFSLSGVVWGRETVWCDDSGRLAALVGQDAEFDHFEATRPELEAAVPQLVGRAAADGMAAMAETAAAISPAPTRVIAVTGGTILDMTARKPIVNGTVVVVDGRIAAAGPANRVTIPAGAVVVNAAGKTVMPGLWDMHAHFEQVEWGPIYLAAGVTTVRDVGNEFDFIVAVRDAIAAGKGLGPRMLLAGIIDGPGPNGLGAVRAGTADEARKRVDRYHDAGFAQIKIYSSVPLDVLRAITGEAHRLGMTVTGHVPEGMSTLAAIDAGLDQINHAQYLTGSSASDTLIAALRKHKTVVDPTLALYELLARPLNQPIDMFEPGIKKVARELETPLGGFGSAPEFAAERKRQFDDEVAVVGALHRAGIPIVAGTDQSVPGHSLHREIELYVQAGFSPLEALQAATAVPARVMGRDADSGTIQPGKRGDLIVLDGNPLEDIHHTRRIFRVITGDRVFDPAPLWQSVGFRP